MAWLMAMNHGMPPGQPLVEPEGENSWWRETRIPEKVLHDPVNNREVVITARVGKSIGKPIPEPPPAACQLVLNGNTRTLNDIFSSKYRYAVSQRLKHIIEDLEPDVHQFFPADYTFKDDGGKPDGAFFLFNVCTVLDAVDTEQTVAIRQNYGFSPYPPVGVDRSQMRIVLKRDVIAGKAAWLDVNLSGHVVSDALHDAICRFNPRAVTFSELVEHATEELR